MIIILTRMGMITFVIAFDIAMPYRHRRLARSAPAAHRLALACPCGLASPPQQTTGLWGRVQRKPGVNPRLQDRQDVHTLPAIPLKTERLLMSNARQWIIAALKGAGKNKNGRPHPMSVSQIMAAIGRTDRNAVDQLLYKMRKAGELEAVGRGLYILGKNVSAPDQSDRQSDQEPNLTGPDVAVPDVAGNLTGIEESPTTRPIEEASQATAESQGWVISEADAARRADRYRAARKDKGDLIATRALRWGLQDAGVLYEQLEREVDRIRQLAEH
jgi:hypothetical protein